MKHLDQVAVPPYAQCAGHKLKNLGPSRWARFASSATWAIHNRANGLWERRRGPLWEVLHKVTPFSFVGECAFLDLWEPLHLLTRSGICTPVVSWPDLMVRTSSGLDAAVSTLWLGDHTVCLNTVDIMIANSYITRSVLSTSQSKDLRWGCRNTFDYAVHASRLLRKWCDMQMQELLKLMLATSCFASLHMFLCFVSDWSLVKAPQIDN